jgi:adenylate kinase family enzyme
MSARIQVYEKPKYGFHLLIWCIACVYGFMAHIIPLESIIGISAVLLLIVLIANVKRTPDENVDTVIKEFFGRAEKPSTWSVYRKTFPDFQFVDIYKNAEKFVEEQEDSSLKTIHVNLQKNLTDILNGSFHMGEVRKIQPAEMRAHKLSHAREEFLPNDIIWLLKPKKSSRQDRNANVIIYIANYEYQNELALTVASSDTEYGKKILDHVVEYAGKNSIYRNQLIELDFFREIKDHYGDVERTSRISLKFKNNEIKEERDVILSEEVRHLIDRTIIDFHNRRKILAQAGIPNKRGILFYGPPGTGKTHTCKYVAYKLPDATKIVASGNALGQIRNICNIAKMFQPAIVILEDIDLMFVDRDINHNNGLLGELMDQLDGFSEKDEVIFIMTTNSISRIESAIKDRPGRVSQCIYMGSPSRILRERYLKNMLDKYDTAKLDIERIVDETEGASQAFLKELVIRAVQISTQTYENPIHGFMLLNEHFTMAQREMTSHGGDYGKRIVGFITNSA